MRCLASAGEQIVRSSTKLFKTQFCVVSHGSVTREPVAIHWVYDDMVENTEQLCVLLKRQQNEIPAEEAIKVLFMYIMIHKLDLYINIAFHPNNDQLSIKRRTGLKRDFKKVKICERRLQQ